MPARSAFSTTVIRSRYWFLAASFVGVLGGYMVSTAVPVSYSGTSRIFLASPQALLPLQFIVSDGADNDEQQRGAAENLVLSVLETHIFNPDIFVAIFSENPQMLDGEIEEINEVSLRDYFLSRVEITRQGPGAASTGSDRVFPTFTIRLVTQEAEINQPILEEYTDVLLQQVEKRVIDAAQAHMDTRVEIANASWKVADATNSVRVKQASTFLMDEIEIAERAGFIEPAFNLEASDFGDGAITNVFPRYFFGTSILKKQLEILLRNANNPELLPEYLAYISLKEQENVRVNILSENNMSILGWHLSSRPSGAAAILSTFFIIFIFTCCVTILLLLVLFCRHLISQNSYSVIAQDAA